jgi:hypothetical protein
MRALPSPRRLSRGKVRRLLVATLALTLCLGIPAQAELSQDGDLLVSFDGGLRPTTLPRSTMAPVAVRVAGDFKSTSAALPQLRTISVSINRAGELYDKGLPVCEVDNIQPASEVEARRVCGSAIVGTGHVVVAVHIPTQEPFTVTGKLLAFNGPRRGNRKTILAQVYSKKPPGAFVLTFTVKREKGLFGTVVSTTMPGSARKWAYLTHFDMTLERTYFYRNKLRSYVSASCAAPDGFPGAVFPFAKATYGFDNGQKLTTTVVRSCRVGEGR